MARVPLSKHLRETVQGIIRSMKATEYHSIKAPPEIGPTTVSGAHEAVKTLDADALVAARMAGANNG